jgi:flavin reductase (DIM6/NTAB) family NADH-FMN oxidoreductase RutF
MAGAIVPRPIAWVSSLSTDGTANLAPFSFFNAVTSTPPILMFSVTKYDEDKPGKFKDTPQNVVNTEEFVVNIVDRSLLEKRNQSSARLEHGRSEFEFADVKRADSRLVDPPRVADSRIAFECRLHDLVPVGRAALVLGDIVHAHIDDELTKDGKLDVRKVDPLGRLSGGMYTFVDNIVKCERPP